MTPSLMQLTKDIKNVDLDDILSSWRWKLNDLKGVATISVLGDIFLLGNDDAVYWLQTDTGDLTKVADNLEQYEQFLSDEEKVVNWFLPFLVKDLLVAGKTLKDNEVYSYKKLPMIGGEYSVDNIESIDISVHFAISGQICEQIQNLPDGTKVRIKVKN